MKALNLTTRKELAGDLKLADTALLRLKGLLGRTSLHPGEGLWIKPCKGVHTFGMKFPIDIIFLDRNNFVVSIVRDLPPNRLTPLSFKAVSVLELPSKTVEMTAAGIGDEIEIA